MLSVGTGALLAFPGAQGFGAYAAGGRGGVVYHVTNLNDSGSGSLRWGIDNANGPTTIVFDVGGTIQLNSPLLIDKSYLTIAGQTAPGDGIAVTGRTTSIVDVHDVIFRYMRFRRGDLDMVSDDSLNVYQSQNVIIDHVSTSWGTDETLSVTESNNVTVQDCIIAETLEETTGTTMEPDHAYGSLVRGNVTDATPGGYSFIDNLWISNDHRNPGVGSLETYGTENDPNAQLQLDLVNNVIYNWGLEAVHTVQSNDDMYVNLVNEHVDCRPEHLDPRHGHDVGARPGVLSADLAGCRLERPSLRLPVGQCDR